MISGCVGVSLKIANAQFMVSYDPDGKTAVYSRTGADDGDIEIKHDDADSLCEVMRIDYAQYVADHPEIAL